MPLFGAHMSVAGGLYKAVEAAVALQSQTLQLFTHSPSQWSVSPAASGKAKVRWQAKPLDEDAVQAFRRALSSSGLKYATAHDSYLINLASPDDEVRSRSIAAFTNEIDRAERLGLTYLVTHPGAHMGSGEEAGLDRVVAALDAIHADRPEAKVKVLIELTAGQGTSLGHRFEHLGHILQGVKQTRRLGVCFDTCHALAAGYSLDPTNGDYDRTFDEFDRVVGLKKLLVFHVNDSKKPLGSRVDRHEHLGRGHVGIETFRRLVNDPRFAKLPMILETPKEDGDTEMDPVNLATLRGL